MTTKPYTPEVIGFNDVEGNGVHILASEIVAIEFGVPSCVYAKSGVKWRVSHSTAKSVDEQLHWDEMR